MANNRLYLYCPECNKCLFLGKNFGGKYNIMSYGLTLDNIQAFFDEHRWHVGVQLAEESGECDTMTGVEIPIDAEREWFKGVSYEVEKHSDIYSN